MKIKFYPYDFDYKIKDNVPFIYLYSKLEDNTKICVIQPYQPYFYVQVEKHDQEELEKKLNQLAEIENNITNNGEKVTKWEIVEREFLGKKSKFWKIFANFPKAVPILSKHLESCGVQCYEKDILFVHRYLRDKDITPMTLVQAEGEFNDEIENNLRIPVFLAENIVQESKESIKNVKILALDIETYNKTKIIDMEKNPILMIAFYGQDENNKEFKKVITWKKFNNKLNYLESVNNEIELLDRFRQIMLDYQPDIITGYFSDGFDFPYIKARADKYKIKLNFNLDRSELETGKKTSFGEGKSRFIGITHIDVFKFIKKVLGKNLKTESFSLNAVSEELLGEKKKDIEIQNLANVWDNQPEQLTDFCEYNLHDAHLAYLLCQNLLSSMIEFSKIIGLPLFDLTRMSFSRLVENYILNRAIEFDVLAPNRPEHQDISRRIEESYQGGFVYEPNPGMYQDIIIFDFRSLYPTIITAHNIGPESLKCKCCEKEGRIQINDTVNVNKVKGMSGSMNISQNYWFCTKDKKFIPNILERVILRRISLKRLIKETKEKGEDTKILEARSYALKTLANSFYGYLGFYGARWYCLECVESITAYARNYIKETINKAKEKGFEVVYGDSLTQERKIFIMNPDGNINLTPIGQFVDKNLKNKNINDYKTLAFDGHKVVFSKIKRIIRHNYNSKEKGKTVRFVTTHGSTRVTPQHSIYKYESNQIKLTDAQTIKKTDKLISVTNVPKFEKYKVGYLFDLANLSFGKIEKEICFYEDNLQFSSKKGICPYCNKEVYLASHVFNMHKNRKISKRKNIPSKYNWVGTAKAGGGRIPRYWKLTTKLAWILGYYCADGSVSDVNTKTGRKCLLSFGSQDLKKIKIVKNYFNNLFKKDLKIITNFDKRINKNMYYYRIQRIPLVGLFETGFGCGKGSLGKEVPSFIYTSEEKIRKEFIKGYLAGDGNLKKDKKYKTHFINCDTNSKSLACGLQYLFKSIDHGKTYFNKEIKHIGWKYRKDKPNISSLRIQSIYKQEDEKENFCAARIKEIKKESYRGYVYDLEVVNEHNFIDAEGLILVHNTDSLFLLLGDQIMDQAMEFMNEINFSLPGHMELEFEGHFPRGIFVATKDSDKGAKKKYALINEKREIKITGFETVRRNWSIIAKEVQEKVLRLVLEDKANEALEYVKDVVKELKKGQISLKKLIIKTQITKELSSYSSIGPHVAIGLRMLEQGIPVVPGMIVEYVICKGSGLVRERAKLVNEIKEGDYDYSYYLNNQIIPAVSTIFAVLGIKENELLGESSQSGLNKFF